MTKLQKDHLMILLESIETKVQVTLESVSRLDNKIDAVRDELKEDIAILDCNAIKYGRCVFLRLKDKTSMILGCACLAINNT